MSHEIRRHDRLVLNSGEPAWHGLGTVLNRHLPPREAVRLVLPWEPAPRPVFVFNPLTGLHEEVPGYKANVRDDTGEVLGVVSDGYRIVPNAALGDFAEALVGADATINCETAGSLMNGRRVFLLCRLPATIRVGRTRNDHTEQYLLISNTHDGTSALFAMWTSIRVVCNNTLTASVGSNFSAAEDAASSGRAFRFRHTGDIDAKIAEARRLLGIATTQAEEFAALAHRLSLHTLTPARLLEYFKACYVSIYGPRPTDGPLELRETWDDRLLTRTNEWLALFSEPTNTHDGIGGTAWAALNAVTEWHDHRRSLTRVTGDRRLHSRYFGEAARDKRAALTCALALL